MEKSSSLNGAAEEGAGFEWERATTTERLDYCQHLESEVVRLRGQLAQEQQFKITAKSCLELNTSLDYDEVLDRILEQVQQVVPSDSANIMLLEGSRVYAVRWHGYQQFGPQLVEISTFACDITEVPNFQQLLASQEPLVIADTRTSANWQRLTSYDWLRSYAAAPIMIDGEVAGFLNVGSVTSDAFTPAHAKELAAFAVHAAATLKNARLYEKLRRSEERYARFFNISPDSIIISSLADGRYLEVNESFLRTLGYRRAEVIGHTSVELHTWPDRAARERFVQLLQAQGVVTNFETRFRRKSGEVGVSLMSSGIIELKSGPGLLTIAKDITPRVAAEKAREEYANRLAALHALDQAVRNTPTPVKIAEVAIQQLRQLISCWMVCIFSFDSEEQEATLLASSLEKQRVRPGTTISPWCDIKSVAALREGKVQVVADIDTLPTLPAAVKKLSTQGLRAYAGIPLLNQGKLRGVIYLGRNEPGTFTPAELVHAREIANLLAIAFYNVELSLLTQKLLEQRTNELLTIRRVAKAINEIPLMATILEQGLHEMLTTSPAMAGAIYLRKSSGVSGELQLQVSHNLSSEFLSSHHELLLAQLPPLLEQALHVGRVVVFDGLPPSHVTLSAPSALKEWGFGSGLFLPLYIHERGLGFVVLGAEGPHAFSATTQDFLYCIADQIALAVEGAHLLAQAQQDTQIKANLLHEVNHRVKNNLTAILGILALEMERAESTEVSLAAVLVDMQERIRGLALVHDLLSNADWDYLSLEELAAAIVRSALASAPYRPHLEIAQTPAAEPLMVSPRNATALALILNELATNSIKHALSEKSLGEIKITITLVGQEVTLQYRDNGPGWSAEALNGESGGVGLQLIRGVVRSPLRGALTLVNAAGAVATITFRLPQKIKQS
ncbi:MAG: GAF domain-containing protein [Chloroflexota bacterium]|nr:GAF domain-containing protein [Chloroflexota bacterium]